MQTTDCHYDHQRADTWGCQPRLYSRYTLPIFLFPILSSDTDAYTNSPFALLATREQMSEARLPIRYRDSCAGLLIPLNRCRFEEYYLPWKCEVSVTNEVLFAVMDVDALTCNRIQTERHSYEKCQYEEFKKRVAKMDELRAAKGGARSN